MHKRIAKLAERMDALQTALYAEAKHALLVVLQASDGAGRTARSGGCSGSSTLKDAR